MEIKRKQIIDENGHLRNTSIWNIEVDYTNLNDLEGLYKKIKSQIGSLRTMTIGSKREVKQNRFDACASIYNTDITELYKDHELDSSRVYYVYAHCEPNKIAIGRDGVTSWAASLGLDLIPVYIGKGTGNRAYDLNRNETHRKVRQRLKEFNSDLQVRIIKDGLTELEALCLESKLIDIFGLIGKGGRLVNLDEGANSKERQLRYATHLVKINKFYKNSLKVD
jgi:hypothetical protein